jgi:drug/metabolite transporter (DMT)-like permease
MAKTVCLVLLYVVCGAIGNLLVGCGMRGKCMSVPHVLGGTLVLCLAYGIYLGLLKNVPLSVVVPAGAASYILIAAFSRWILHEAVPPTRWVGALVVSVGVMIVLFSDRPTPDPAPPEQSAAMAWNHR